MDATEPDWERLIAEQTTSVMTLGEFCASRVLAMDETPHRAGQEKKGKLHRGYVWVLYGNKDEVAARTLKPSAALDESGIARPFRWSHQGERMDDQSLMHSARATGRVSGRVATQLAPADMSIAPLPLFSMEGIGAPFVVGMISMCSAAL